jgi:hypothetical protein
MHVSVLPFGASGPKADWVEYVFGELIGLSTAQLADLQRREVIL